MVRKIGQTVGWVSVVAGSLSLASSGCQTSDGEEWEGSDEYEYESVSLEVRRAEISGSLGEVTGVDGSATFVDASTDGYWTHISLWAEDGSPDDWTLMTALELDAAEAARILKPGTETHIPANSDLVFSYACSWAGAEGSEYEATGRTVDIVVTESDLPGMVNVAYTGSYEGPDGMVQVMRARFDIVAMP